MDLPDCMEVCSFSTTSPSLDEVVFDGDARDFSEGLGQGLGRIRGW